MKFFYSFQKRNSSKRGFTLIETFIAITIIMIVIVGPLTLAQKGLSSAAYSKDKITGYYLAQDAIEYIHWLRDQAALNGGGWAGFKATVANCINSLCTADTSIYGTQPTVVASCFGVCSNLQYNTATGLYGYDFMNQKYPPGSVDPISQKLVWNPSVYKRTIVITPNTANPDEVQVEAQVSFSGKNEPPVDITDNILNWK